MGRAYEVRKASIQKTGAAKAKLYSVYAREIYQIAKNGGTNPDMNHELKNVISRAKKEQVPSDIIKRAIEKVTSGTGEDYSKLMYEVYGPGGSNLLIECLTDNVNRTISYLNPAINKNNAKFGVQGSVTFLYDHLSIVAVKELSEEEVMDALITNDVDVVDIETQDETVVIYGDPADLFKIKEALKTVNSEIEFDTEEITYIAQNEITLEGDNLIAFNKMISMLDEIEDVAKVYHNVKEAN